ncbi:Uncharacterized protein Fot_37910 [Forsythia ovata]|uniref:Uncharacterized protein n=1 Tax=Forsythia ovata TaxID=205694 RepID=A0ABD1S2L1_9LAMI
MVRSGPSYKRGGRRHIAILHRQFAKTIKFSKIRNNGRNEARAKMVELICLDTIDCVENNQWLEPRPLTNIQRSDVVVDAPPSTLFFLRRPHHILRLFPSMSRLLRFSRLWPPVRCTHSLSLSHQALTLQSLKLSHIMGFDGGTESKLDIKSEEPSGESQHIEHIKEPPKSGSDFAIEDEEVNESSDDEDNIFSDEHDASICFTRT